MQPTSYSVTNTFGISRKLPRNSSNMTQMFCSQYTALTINDQLNLSPDIIILVCLYLDTNAQNITSPRSSRNVKLLDNLGKRCSLSEILRWSD